MVKRCRRVVLVDGDATILDAGGRAIQRLGHRVQTASSCDSICRIAEQNRDCIDLVVLDDGDGASNGRSVLNRLKEINSNIKILLTGDFCEFGPVSNLLNEQGIDFIHAPFTTAELTEKVSWMLS